MNRYFILIGFFFAALTPLSAHPHMFLESRFIFDVDADSLNGVWIEWKFDDYFSTDVIYSYDLDGNRQFDPGEVRDIYENAFSYVGHFNYFVFVKQGNRRTGITEVSDFMAWLDDGILYYTFYIDLRKYDPQNFTIAVYDPTFFCSVKYPGKNLVSCTSRSAGTLNWTLVKDPDNPVYYDPYGSTSEMVIYDEWQPGFMTFVPTEVKIVF